MMIEPKRPIVADKELKVRIPQQLHLGLYALKLHEGQTIQQTVSIALRRYLDGLREGSTRSP